MNSRQRFHETLRFGQPDRVPLFLEGIRSDVISAWRDQGMPAGKTLDQLFMSDMRSDILPDLEPRPPMPPDLLHKHTVRDLQMRYDPADPERLPKNWEARFNDWSRQGSTVMLRVHRGLYQTLGVGDWQGFASVNLLFVDDPSRVQELLAVQAEFAAQMVLKILSRVSIDAAVFSEPISDNNGPLISPQMFAEFGRTSYLPVIDALQRSGVETLIFRSYANARALLPVVREWGLNCIWACEENFGDLDYRKLRRQCGPELRLIGGIDVDVLRADKAAIRDEVFSKVPPLLAQGGFIPLADGRIREQVSYENYAYYRSVLQEVVCQS